MYIAALHLVRFDRLVWREERLVRNKLSALICSAFVTKKK